MSEPIITREVIAAVLLGWTAFAFALGVLVGRIYKPTPKPERITDYEARRRQRNAAVGPVTRQAPPAPDPRSNPNVHIREFGRQGAR